MARHSNGKNTFAVAGWVIALAIVVIVAVIAGIIWALGRGGESAGDNAAAPSTAQAVVESESNAAADDTKAEDGDAPKASESAKAGAQETKKADEKQQADSAKKVADTLIVFDTSNNMAQSFAPVSNALAETANAIGADGKQVAVWNYSSPLNPGVVVGYRQNLGFGAAQDAAGVITAFGTGGVPQTRSAVVAAVAAAADQAGATGQPVRVVTVTTGTEQDMDDAQFTEALEAAKSKDVVLAVVHVGGVAKDAVLEKAADSFATVKDASDQKKVEEALSKAAAV